MGAGKSDHFADRLTAAIRAKRTAAVVGIDPVLEGLPAALRPESRDLLSAVSAVEAFCADVIGAVAGHVPAVKINSGFFEAFFDLGVTSFYRIVAEAHERGLLVIADVKRGDIGSTARLYALGHLADPRRRFPELEPRNLPDAVTLSGYLGQGSVQPFIDIARDEGKGLYILVRPSDPGADRVHEFGAGEKLYQFMGRLVHEWGDGPGLVGSCGLSCVGAVVAPKDAESTRALREALPQTPFLVPGYGAQGAGAEACRPCFRASGDGAVVNASRSVIYAFENPKYAEQLGDGWQACVEAAARDFAADIRTCGLPG